MLARKRAGKAVFNFVFIARRGGAFTKRVSGLLTEASAIELIGTGEERRIGVGVEGAILAATEGVLPMGAGPEIPAQMNEQNFQSFVLREACRDQERGAGNSGEARIAAHGQAQLVGIAETVAKIAGEAAI